MPYLLLLIGVYCCSTSIIFIKIGSTDPVALSAYRLLLGGLFMVPLAYRSWKRRGAFSAGQMFRQAAAPSVLLGIHFISWIFGGRLTPSANASLIVNMVPVVMPVFLLLVVGERINRPEGIGTVVAMMGVAALGWADFNLSSDYAAGDLVCFISMLFYAYYLIYARKYRDMPSIYLYVVPVYLMGGLFCLLGGLAMELAGQPIVWLGPDLKMEAISILGLALIPTIFGHSLVNWAMTRIRSQAVVIINLAQFIFAGTMGFLLLGEIPPAAFYLSSAMVVAGAVVIVRHSHQNR
ncbi:MAG: DMT family transporter [Opitutales bacterium]|jgi:drug/metabolite transporter (DMT)-like permease